MLPSRSAIRKLVFAALLSAGAAAAETPPSAASLLSDAQAQAAQGQRAIFAIFHASW
jgi:hypothetical protein